MQQACVSGHITSASRCRTFASATAPAPKKEGEGRGSSYVSPHDWSSIEKQYGKADTSAALKPVEIHTITATSRTLEQQGSRYSRKIREGKTHTTTNPPPYFPLMNASHIF